MKYVLDGAMNSNKDDIFYKPVTSDEWLKLIKERYISIKHMSNKSFNKKYKELEDQALTLAAAASRGLTARKISFTGIINIGFNALYYVISPDKKKQQAELFLSNPDPLSTTNLLNLLDSKYTKPILNILMPNIVVNMKIYVPKLLPILTIKNIHMKRDLSGYLNKSTNASIELEKDISSESLLGFNPVLRSEFTGQPSSYISHKIKILDGKYVKIRILSPDTLPKDYDSEVEPIIKGMNFDRILIDIHGGGFIGTSTRCHQTYLRKWANECNLVIFAIDYKLAPEAKYPAVLDDIWQAYFWIITHAEIELGVKLNTVIVAGDSAGGNLAMALTLFAIRSKFRIPDGLLLGYPALNLSMRSFTPSLLTSLDDWMLRYSFLNVCIESYIPLGADPTKDPYLSPALIPDEDLRQFPSIRIMAAGRDPLRDESMSTYPSINTFT